MGAGRDLMAFLFMPYKGVVNDDEGFNLLFNIHVTSIEPTERKYQILNLSTKVKNLMDAVIKVNGYNNVHLLSSAERFIKYCENKEATYITDIFTSEKGSKIFTEWLNIHKGKTGEFNSFSYIFHQLKKDGFINDKVKAVHFIDYLATKDIIISEKLNSIDKCYPKKKDTLYEKVKSSLKT